MARKKPLPKKAAAGSGDHVMPWITSIVLFALSLLTAFAAAGSGGTVGQATFSFFTEVLGVGAYLLPVVFLVAGVSVVKGKSIISLGSIIGGGVITLAILSFLGMVTVTRGGLLGTSLGSMLTQLFGFGGALIFLITIVLIGSIVVFNAHKLLAALFKLLMEIAKALRSIIPKRTPKEDAEEEDEEETEEEEVSEVPEDEEGPEEEKAMEAAPIVKNFSDAPAAVAKAIPTIDTEYQAPPLSLLGDDTGKPATGDVKANANIIKRCLQNFGISVEMDEVSIGPTVTRYAMKPAEGVRLSKILSLQNNLELALAAHPVRIEAPIPGKSLVGIEVPNVSKAMVGLRGTMSAAEWTTNTKPLLAALGRDITGTSRYLNIAKAPHALVAGATGSGKSVAIHAIITSLLYRNGPNQLRFIMVDPKRVELTIYNGIPHLLTPVITDPKKAILSLKWAAKEMERRYNILEAEQVRDIDSYHTTVFEPAKAKAAKKGEDAAQLPEAMPYIVIVIDELADIMQSYPRELEAGIVRLAQMSRAVGIHLVLSTQRPSVNVITGLIKANVPTRLALQVASQIDSRTILDGSGAEMLLGAGDMLYLSADMQKPVRVQTAYISEEEAKKVVKYIKEHNAGDGSLLDFGPGGSGNSNTDPNTAIMLADGDDEVDDDLYEQAKAAVEEAGRASTSYLQRKLRIGYSRAARLMDILEERSVIGPADGSRPRDVLTGAKAGGAAGDDVDSQEF